MRVLIAGLYVPSGHHRIGGLQTWIYTVRAELERRGHEVCEWQHGDPEPGGPFDLGIIANARHTKKAAGRCRRRINISHGPIREEQPREGFDRWFYVSEGVRAHWRNEGGPHGDIIRQPIDLEFWTPGDFNERRGVVRFSYRGTQTHAEAVAQAMDEPYERLHGVTPEGARVVLRRAALVFASGRAALEAMACGAPTVVYDNRAAYQRPLLDECLDRQMHNSYSGRGGYSPSAEQVLAAGERAMHHSADCWRSWVERHHDARKIVDQLLNPD